MKINYLFLSVCFLFLPFSSLMAKDPICILNNLKSKQIDFGNSKFSVRLDCNEKCVITDMKVNGESVISENDGIFSAIRTSEGNYSTRKLAESPRIKVVGNKIICSNIKYGNKNAFVKEIWKFIVTQNDISLNIKRSVLNSFVAEDVAFPAIKFNSIHTWNGAFLGFGGLAWFSLFNERLSTYGVHTDHTSFWNSTTGNGLRISTSARGKQIASKFSRTTDDGLIYVVSVSDKEMKYRYDTDTKRRRFLRGKTDVWDSFLIPAGEYAETVTFKGINYREEYNRGHFVGIDGDEVNNLLNTIARIGVIDAKHFGGNSWATPYGPICLHEQYIAQLGIGINDEDYLNGYKQCLDYYRDNAIRPDGRVLPRWAYTDEDAMPGMTTSQGFYEAQWGYLLDSNPDFVTNVSDLYNQCGDLKWIRKYKASCENVLGYMLKRDSNGNHLVEMKTDSEEEKKGSDWIDIIWASYENAFVNAKLYHALVLWSGVEKQLGDSEKASYYSNYAVALKSSFNKSIESGGFWNEKKQWYVHWLDKDRSAHGDNLVIPVNFMAIAYGICDDQKRKKVILDQIERQMQKEKLFAWPLCLYSYARGEGNDWQFPFPNYENGDIFLSWGEVGVEAYASYCPELALKYIENILARYEIDGLAFQRYGRVRQDGLGDDILSGNSLAIVGLYKSIYGINPMYNRMYLNPHLPEKLAGTVLNYKFRGDNLIIGLNKNYYSISNRQFKLVSSSSFGFQASGNMLEYFHLNSNNCCLNAQVKKAEKLSLKIVQWDGDNLKWNQNTLGKKNLVSYIIYRLKPFRRYAVSISGRVSEVLKTDSTGCLKFKVKANASESGVCIQLN